MQRIRELWASDRGRLVHYLVAASLGVFVIVEYATMTTILGDPVDNREWVTLLAVVAAVALLLIRRFPFVAPLVAGISIASTLLFVPGYVARDADAPFLIAVLFVPWCLGTYNERWKAVAGLVAENARRVMAIADAHGIPVLTDRDRHAGIVALAPEPGRAGVIAAELANSGVIATVRDGLIRVSAHAGTSDAAFDLLEGALAASQSGPIVSPPAAVLPLLG